MREFCFEIKRFYGGDIFGEKLMMREFCFEKKRFYGGRNRCGLSTAHSMASLTVCKPKERFPCCVFSLFIFAALILQIQNHGNKSQLSRAIN